MGNLICEICGSSDWLKEDGVFVCQSCNMKYTIDEMKKLLNSDNNIQQSKIMDENTNFIDTYIFMAENAYLANNLFEAELYCNKIIEVQPTNYKAWMIKGKSVAWQSTLRNMRLNEGITDFTNALQYAPENEKEEIFDDIKEQIKQLSISVISLYIEHFKNFQDEDTANALITNLPAMLNFLTDFFADSGDDEIAEEIKYLAINQVNNALYNVWREISKEYYRENSYGFEEDHPNQYEWEVLINKSGLCIDILKKVIDICHDDDVNIILCDSLINLCDFIIDSRYWDYSFTPAGTKFWLPKGGISDFVKQQYKELMNKYESKKSRYEANIARKD